MLFMRVYHNCHRARTKCCCCVFFLQCSRSYCWCQCMFVSQEVSPPDIIGEVAHKLLSSSSAGQCYSLASQGGLMSEPHSVPLQPFPPSSGKGRPRSSNKKSKAKSPYPFSVESMSSGCQQPSPQVSILAAAEFPQKVGLMVFLDPPLLVLTTYLIGATGADVLVCLWDILIT